MSATPFAEKVLLTGASGYLATHIIDQLFAIGYEVVGTVRSSEKGDWTAQRFPGFKYETVKELADVGRYEDIFQKHQDIKYVLHTASPVSMAQSDFVEHFVTPAVDGTKGILEAAKKYGKNVKKFVFTSSFAALASLSVGPQRPDITLSNKSWNPVTMEEAAQNVFSAYFAGKTFA